MTLPFPVEILHQIFTVACLDDGKTGCALALVSTRMRDISRPFRYQSLKLSGMVQLKAFLNSVLRNRGPHDLGIKYLYLDTRSPFKDSAYYETTPYNDIIKNQERHLTNVEVMDLTYTWRSQIVPVLHEIIGACSFGLVMLHFQTQHASLSLESYRFACLEELHVFSGAAFDWSMNQFPRLRRIRLPEFSQSFLEHASIPTLEVLRVWARTPNLVQVLCNDGNDKGVILCVHSVQKLLLELHSHESSMKDGVQARFRSDKRISLVLSRLEQIERDWWDSVNGGLGCFVEN